MAAHSPHATALLMHRSFAQFRRSLCVTVGAFAIALALVVPVAAQDAPMPELLAAQQAVSRADQADADQYAPDLINAARSGLAQAQAAVSSRRDRKLAPPLALRAAADADLARVRSNEAVANAELQQRRTEISELQRTLGVEGNP